MKPSLKNNNIPSAALVAATPEFVDARGVRVVFGLSRSHAYELSTAGSIKSVSIRRPGAVRGRRLFDCASIRSFLASLAEHSKTIEGATN